MSFVRPEIAARLRRWREVLVGLGVVLAGGWLAGLGGWFFAGLGGLVALARLGLGAAGLRRLRFRATGQAPGLVRTVEGQVGYFGPETGGFAALTEIEALCLDVTSAGPAWVLVQPEGQLRIPVAADGAERLYDFFGALPGIDMAAVTAAARDPGPVSRTLWRRRSSLRLRG